MSPSSQRPASQTRSSYRHPHESASGEPGPETAGSETARPETANVETASPGTTTPETSRTSEALQAKRAQILAGAGKVFLQAGYEGASMSEIARTAGVSKGTLYNHFASKDALFTAFFEKTSHTMHNALQALSRDAGTDLRSGLMQAALAIINVLLEPDAMGLYRIIVAEAARFPHLADTFWQYGFGRTLGNLSGWFERCAADGQLALPDASFAAEQFMVLCQTRIVQRKRLMLPVRDDQASIARVAALTADSFLRIYAPRA